MLEVIKVNNIYNIRISNRALIAVALIVSAGIASVGAVMTHIVLTDAQKQLAILAAQVDLAKREMRQTETQIARTCWGLNRDEREKL